MYLINQKPQKAVTPKVTAFAQQKHYLLNTTKL
jgi:hypothetical protein